MESELVHEDGWIIGQLAGIHMLEQELTNAFKKPTARAGEDLRRRLAQLNSWLNVVDDALTLRTRSDKSSRQAVARAERGAGSVSRARVG
jgi:hypothetical protein